MKKQCKTCPFDPAKEVRPFSNGSEAMDWHARNCDRCLNYESEITSREAAKCKPAYDIDLGFIISEIPLQSAIEIGCKYDPLYGTVILHKECRNFNDKDDPKPF